MKNEDKYVEGLDLSKLPSQARQVLIALGQYQNGAPITQRCPRCDQLLAVEKAGTAWLITCDCGF
jgi:hypothetical protein